MIEFNKPTLLGHEFDYMQDAVDRAHLRGVGHYTRRCEALIEEATGAARVLLTTSCTAALELAALLCQVEPGDEVVLPSFTFVSTANAFLLRGARLRFVDIRPDTLNLDEEQAAQALNERTRVIVPVHYAGVACEMDAILELARTHDLSVVEDAAQAIDARYKDRALGTFGQLGAISFHDTKNLTCGEGGALLVNDPSLAARAEILREKGTNRSAFFRGEVDKYTWLDLGSSTAPSDLLAAFLLAQLEAINSVTQRRQAVCQFYQRSLAPLAETGVLQLPTIPQHCTPSYHLFYIVLGSLEHRSGLIAHLRDASIQAVFHYVPLHSSPMGEKLGYRAGMLPVTESLSDRLVRLPLHLSLSEADLWRVVSAIYDYFKLEPPSDGGPFMPDSAPSPRPK